jgi:predicted lipid carrier protein YhbT
MPFVLQRKFFDALLRHVFRRAMAEGELDFLQGHWLAVRIEDLDWQLQLSCNPDRSLCLRPGGSASTEIRGPLRSFILLAAQREDPDTLFFRRELVIEGNTDLGLQVKNWLDSLDSDELPPALLFPLRCAAEYVTLFPDTLQR